MGAAALIVDASAVVAIALDEADAGAFSAALGASTPKRMSAANHFEAALRLERGGGFDLDALLALGAVSVVPATPAHARAALDAWRRFGKGRHPARLNMGDCFAHALAREAGAPLLFKGDDFSHTDIRSAL